MVRRGNLSPEPEPVTDVPAGLWGAINLAHKARYEGKRRATIAYGDYLYEFSIDKYGQYKLIERWRIL